ncbi:RNA polymerase II elongation factor ELL-like isoform X1 [Trichomycterus rosablanca]|uniref:RNA polymerase II elongation factor ELL-like isoform X1 n=1 Tax=Trichomycterus rosablanca TaxID=2290929 RepID=UPI002F350568
MEQFAAPKGRKRCREADVEESPPSKRHHAEEGQRLSPAETAGTALVNEPFTPVSPGYKLKYPKVVMLSQKRMYMRVYKEISKEYCVLHARVDGLETCSHLQPRPKMFQKVHEGTQADKNLLEQNLNQTNLRQRLFYLHHKLSHIKRLCDEFDYWRRKQLKTKAKRSQDRNNPGHF